MYKRYLLVLALLLAQPSVAMAIVSMGDGTKAVAVAGTAEALVGEQTIATTVVVCADTNNTGIIAVGNSPVATAGSQEGATLSSGQCISLYTNPRNNSFNLQNIQVDATVSGEDVSFYYFNE